MRAAGVELIGELPGSGYKEPPALVRRADGQTVQLTRLLYVVLEEIDGQRGRTTSSRRGQQLAFGRRRDAPSRSPPSSTASCGPLGVLVLADGTEPERSSRSNPLLAVKVKKVVTDPAVTRRLTAPFAVLFHPLVVVPLHAGLRGRRRVGALPRGTRRRDPRRLHRARAVPAGLRRHGALGRLPRVRPRCRLPLRRRDARRHGRRALPGLAGVLHRGERQLPPRSSRPGPRRPRRAVLQRGLRARDVRGLGGHALGGAAARHRRAGACRCCASWRRSSGSTATTSSPT